MSLGRHWWDQLDFFAPDVLRDLGRLFLQLERAFSSLPAKAAKGEPAGWSGLTRRGSWDRLNHSEWALAEAAPEEFVRRAGQGELNFWETAQQAGAQQELLWCWLDVGPDQLGACRLVQLALLFYLQHLVTGKFCWGCIQHPQTGYDALGPEEVRHYLRSRSCDPGRRPPDLPGVNLWCIGSPAWLSQVPASFHKIALTQQGPETVELSYGPRRLSLQLPPGERAARLLRDPFSQVREPARTTLQTGGELGFSGDGRKLALVEGNAITMIPLPSSVSEPPGKVRRYGLKRWGRVVAFSWERNSLHVCQENDGQWNFYRVNPSNQEQQRMLTVPAQSGAGLGCCWPAGRGYYLYLDGRFWEFGQDFCEQRLEALNHQVWGSRSILADRDLHQLVTPDGAPLHQLPAGPVQRVFLGGGNGQGLDRIGQIVALHHGQDNYQILLREGKCLVLRTRGTVIGVTMVARYQQPALVVRHPQHFQLLGTDFSEMVEVGLPIEQANMHLNGLLAYRTQGGQLHCYDTPSQTSLWTS